MNDMHFLGHEEIGLGAADQHQQSVQQYLNGFNCKAKNDCI